MDISNFIGDAPTWIASGAVILAAVQYKSEGRSRRAEAEREARSQASQLIAWAATCRTDDHKPEYGVVVSNNSGSTFHQVQIHATLHGKRAPRPIELVILPPGNYWIRFNGSQDAYMWDFARHVREHEGILRPYMKTEGYLVNQVSFFDNRNQHWSINEHAVLEEFAEPVVHPESPREVRSISRPLRVS